MPGWRGTAELVALLVLLGVFALLRGWQQEAPVWGDPAPGRCMAALLCMVLYASFCVWVMWRYRRRIDCSGILAIPAGDPGAAPLLVVFASQTGFAESLAIRSAKALVAAGVAVRMVSIAALEAADLLKAERALFVVSTYGEGDPPDMAGVFVRRWMHEALSLSHLHYGLLALGDREYANFCGFGRQLDAWLRGRQARALFDPIEVDNGDEGSLRHWQHQLGVLSGATDQADWNAPQYTRWRLVERRRLNPGSVGGACFHLVLQPENPGDARWEAGDVAEIGPRNAANEVNALLAAGGLDGASAAPVRDSAPVDAANLREYLARCHLPDPAAITDQAPLDWLATLKPLAHREYSIASVPADGAVHLLVRQWRRADGGLGIGGGWLTEHAALGELIHLRLRTNSNFHMPVDARPLILIGNGTGIAGLRALLKARVAAGHRRNWLLFGERQARIDFFYGDELRAWHAESWVARLDLAFSRDQEQRIHVQQRLREAADTLRHWVDDGAAIQVCGSLVGMAPAVDAVLREVLGDACIEHLIAAGRYRRDVY